MKFRMALEGARCAEGGGGGWLCMLGEDQGGTGSPGGLHTGGVF